MQRNAAQQRKGLRARVPCAGRWGGLAAELAMGWWANRSTVDPSTFKELELEQLGGTRELQVHLWPGVQKPARKLALRCDGRAQKMCRNRPQFVTVRDEPLQPPGQTVDSNLKGPAPLRHRRPPRPGDSDL